MLKGRVPPDKDLKKEISQAVRLYFYYDLISVQEFLDRVIRLISEVCDCSQVMFYLSFLLPFGFANYIKNAYMSVLF